MPDLECRVANLESRVSHLEERAAASDEKVRGMAEVLVDRRRQSDKFMEILEDIQGKINVMQSKVDGMQGFSDGIKWSLMIAIGAIGFIAAKIFNKIFPQ